jgi:hypothetical protein
MKKATKPWHGRTFDQYISKEKFQPSKKKNLPKKKVKKTPTLVDVAWMPFENGRFWVTEMPEKVRLKDLVFYDASIDNSGPFFCSFDTYTAWKNYRPNSSTKWVVDNTKSSIFLTLYKLLMMEYYES